jgi:hypothetical protein
MRRNFFRNIPEGRSSVLPRAILALLAVTVLCRSTFADEHSVVFDDHTEFSKLKTFAIRDGKCDSTRPELNNPLYLKRLAETIRAALTAKGMRETAGQPDIFVDYRVVGTEVSTADRPSERLRGGVLFAQGTVTVDLVRRDPKLLVWEGIYHDDESNGSKLAQSLASDIRKLLAKYPPKK